MKKHFPALAIIIVICFSVSCTKAPDPDEIMISKLDNTNWNCNLDFTFDGYGTTSINYQMHLLFNPNIAKFSNDYIEDYDFIYNSELRQIYLTQITRGQIPFDEDIVWIKYYHIATFNENYTAFTGKWHIYANSSYEDTVNPPASFPVNFSINNNWCGTIGQ